MTARIVIRADGSHQVGMGHVFRMANLARALDRAGIGPVAFCGIWDRQVETWLRQRDFAVEILADDVVNLTHMAAWLKVCAAEVVINDILDTDADYMEEIKDSGCRIVNFDDNGLGRDLADCNINALPSNMPTEAGAAVVFSGPDYLLLSAEFSPDTRGRKITSTPSSILVTLGGSDTYGNTLVAVTALQKCNKLQKIDIITGPAFRHWDELSDLVIGDRRCVVHGTVPSLANFMADHELALVGGGITLFEAAACALPTLAVASEDFEEINIQWAEDRGITRMAGAGQPSDSWTIYDSARSLLDNRSERLAMAEAGPRLVDGKGSDRIVDIIRGLCN